MATLLLLQVMGPSTTAPFRGLLLVGLSHSQANSSYHEYALGGHLACSLKLGIRGILHRIGKRAPIHLV